MQLTPEETQKRFSYHAPKDSQPERYNSIRLLGKGYAKAIDDMVPDSREKSLALTKVEEAIFWANAAIARNE